MFEPCLTFDEKGYYLAAIPDDFAKEMKIKTSYQVVAAHLLGFSYPDYLRYARSKGATLKGKEGFGLIVFEKLSDCKAFCAELNTEWEKFKKAVKEDWLIIWHE